MKAASRSRALGILRVLLAFTWVQSFGGNYSVWVKGKGFPPQASFRWTLSCVFVFIEILSKTLTLNRKKKSLLQ